MIKRLPTFGLLFCIAFSCKQSNKHVNAMSAQPTDPTIRQDSYSDLFFDSVSLEKRIADEGMSDSVAIRMRKFYHARGYQYAWFFQNAMAEYAKGFVDV